MAKTKATRIFHISLILGCILTVALGCVALLIGSEGITQALNALIGGGDDLPDILLRDFRLPRVLLAIAIGAALPIAGAIMQVVTRNPLADPGLLGISYGAYFGVIVGLAFGLLSAFWTMLVLPLLGATAIAVLIYFIGNVVTPGQLVLAGISISALLAGLSYAVTLLDRDIFDEVRFWATGSLDNKQWGVVFISLPLIALGVLIAISIVRALNVLAIDKDISKSLGVGRVQFWAYLAVIVLSAASTAAVGPISFLALAAAHIARIISGPDCRKIIAICLVAGPLVLLGSDIIGRLISPSEISAGVVVAFLGSPILISLARKVRTF